MRRAELIEAARALQDALNETKLAELIGLERGKESNRTSTSKSLQALSDYSILGHSFKPATKKLEYIFDIHHLRDPTVWLRLIDFNPASERVKRSIVFALEYLPKIIEMLETEATAEFEGGIGKDASPYKGMRTLTVTIYEPEKLYSSPDRLANVLESINHFYTACALMENESPSTLSVIGCDSGSDKSFDFLGLAKLMECVERLIGTIWDRTFFYRERQFDERLELVAKSLPIIERISVMEQQRQLEPEMAEVLRRNIFDGTNKFLQSGATIPKIEDKSEYNPKALLSPIQKLLVAAPDDYEASGEAAQQDQTGNTTPVEETKPEQNKSTTLDFSDLTDEEQALLAKLLARHIGAVATTSPADEENRGDDITSQGAEVSDSDVKS